MLSRPLPSTPPGNLEEKSGAKSGGISTKLKVLRCRTPEMQIVSNSPHPFTASVHHTAAADSAHILHAAESLPRAWRTERHKPQQPQ